MQSETPWKSSTNCCFHNITRSDPRALIAWSVSGLAFKRPFQILLGLWSSVATAKPHSFVAQIPDFLPICPLHLFLLLSGPIMRDFVPISTDSVIIRDPSSSRSPPSCTAAVLEAKVSWHHRVHGWAAGQLNWTPIARWGRTHNPNSSNSIWYIWYGRYAAKTEMKGVLKADCRTWHSGIPQPQEIGSRWWRSNKRRDQHHC